MSRSRLAFGKLPSAQRVAAVAMLLAQCWTLGFLLEAPVVATCAAAVGLGALLAPQEGWTWSFSRLWWSLGLAVAIALKWTLAPHEVSFNVRFVNSPFAYEVSTYFILLQILFLYRRSERNRLPPMQAGLACAGLVFAFDARLSTNGRWMMAVAVSLFVLSLAFFAHTSRERLDAPRRTWFSLRFGILASIILLSSTLAIAGSRYLYHHERQLQWLLAKFLADHSNRSFGPGFSGHGGLTDVTSLKSASGTQITLRILAEKPPGYLRGRAFDTFSGRQWAVMARPRPVGPLAKEDTPILLPSEPRSFAIHRGQHEPAGQVEIWPITEEGGSHTFLPLETTWVVTQAHSLSVDVHHIVQRDSTLARRPYTAISATHPYRKQVDDWMRSLCIATPESLDPRIAELAEEICGEVRSPREKMLRIEQYFHDNFQYKIGIRVGRRGDPLSVFLFDAKAAHCEYFATAAAVLLRLSGVPTRYVTGYVVREKNAYGDFWLARQRDAHAWVEAYDETSGRWYTVEATPSEGVPESEPAADGEQLAEYLSHLFRSAQQRLSPGKLWGVLQSRVTRQVLIGLVVVVLAAAATVTLWNSTSQLRIKRLVIEQGARQLTVERAAFEKALKSYGLIRERNETVSQFASRILRSIDDERAGAVAEWLRLYARARFAGPLTDDGLQELRKNRMHVQRSLKGWRVQTTHTTDDDEEAQAAHRESASPLT